MAESQIGKVLYLVGEMNGKLDSVSTKLDKMNGSVANHEKRLIVMETSDEITEKIDERYIKKHQRARTFIFAFVGLVFTALNLYSRFVN